MSKIKNKSIRRVRRQNRIRAKITGSAECPRLSVFRSLTAMYLQLIDDEGGKTLASAHSRELAKGKKARAKKDVAASQALGKLLAEKAKAAGISRAVFDRGGYRFHGRVKAAAEGAREGGLEF
jgi:large subunit ribosomal protein L18